MQAVAEQGVVLQQAEGFFQAGLTGLQVVRVAGERLDVRVWLGPLLGDDLGQSQVPCGLKERQWNRHAGLHLIAVRILQDDGCPEPSPCVGVNREGVSSWCDSKSR
ncbi:hypothetical protein D9M71_663060 [compost metagenome]